MKKPVIILAIVLLLMSTVSVQAKDKKIPDLPLYLLVWNPNAKCSQEFINSNENSYGTIFLTGLSDCRPSKIAEKYSYKIFESREKLIKYLNDPICEEQVWNIFRITEDNIFKLKFKKIPVQMYDFKWTDE